MLIILASLAGCMSELSKLENTYCETQDRCRVELGLSAEEANSCSLDIEVPEVPDHVCNSGGPNGGCEVGSYGYFDCTACTCRISDDNLAACIASLEDEQCSNLTDDPSCSAVIICSDLPGTIPGTCDICGITAPTVPLFEDTGA